jgi:S1-C subfamily serine protease
MQAVTRWTVTVGLILLACAPAMGQETNARRTELVRLVELVSPSAVNLVGTVPITGHPGSYTLSWGSGSIIHEAGFILTNDHVAQSEGQQIIILHDGRQYTYTVVATSPNEDLAILRVQPDEPLVPVKLGRSDDVMLGEPVLVIGNPGGLQHTISSGVVTGLGRTGGGGTMMLTDMIQTNANINGGNSGGPMFNALGEQIGIIESKRTDVEGLGFAIQIDRFRRQLPTMLSPEVRYGFELGMTVDSMAAATVTMVQPGSPAEKAGVEIGDTITGVGEMSVRDGVHFYLALVGRSGGERLPMSLVRGDEEIDVVVELASIPLRPADEVEAPQQGIYLDAYRGQWRQLPDFEQLTPVSWGVVPGFGLYVQGETKDFFALRFTGFVEVPADGLYTFSTKSDDGSRLFIGGQLLVSNDGLHGAREASGLVRLAKGKHAIGVEFFEHDGQELIEVFYEGPSLSKQPIPPTALFCVPPTDAPAPTQP